MLPLPIVLLFLLASGRADVSPPHIIFMIIDDLGWNDVSFHGSKQIPTPNIDALAYDGVILNNYYVQPICTPSRGSLMTGNYPIHLGLQHNVIYAEEPWGLSLKETILPQHLKKLGYTTRGIGKWHLGYFHKDYIPTNRGFDSFFGYWNGKEDFYTHFEEGQGTHGLDFHDDDKNAYDYFGQYGTDVFTQKATDIISNHNASEPLFLYLAHQAVHAGNSYSPLQAPPEFVERFSHIKDKDRRIFAGMTSSLDFSVGELFSALNSSGMLENSVIIFTTDNGAAVEGIDESTGSNWPLRGSKYNMWEGGVRGTAFVWSPLLRNASAKISAQLMHISDWLPTLYALAGGNIEDLEIAGYDQWQSICCGEKSPRSVILHNIDEIWKVESIRKGKYKLLKGSVFDGEFDGWFDKEGKKKENVPFSSTDLVVQNELYEKLSVESKVAKILLENYGADTLGYFGGSNLRTNNYCNYQTDGALDKDNKNPNVEPSSECFIDSKSEESRKSPLIVNCGPKPRNESTNCKPMVNSCLFNVEDDPCEYNNLASSLPSVVQELKELLDIYRTQAAPTRNKPADPLANPKYHNYAWIPWQS